MLKVVCAIIVNESKMLITQIGSGSRAFEWEFPGGKIKPGETTEDAVLREIGEELDIEIKIAAPMIAMFYNNGEQDFQLIPFICNIQSGEIKLVEHHDMRWVNFDELEKMNLSAADKQLIQLPENRLILKKYPRKDMHNTC